MRVCMIYYTFSGNTVLLREANALVRKGYKVDIVCLGKNTLGRESPKVGLNVYKIQRREYGRKGVLGYFADYFRFFVKAALFAAWLHIRSPYCVIHVTSPPDFMVFASFVPKFLGAKVILDIHDIVPEFYARKFGLRMENGAVKLLKWMERMATKYSDHVITVTDIWRDTLVGRSVGEKKCSVLLNVPDSEIFCPRQSEHVQCGEEFRLLYHGNLDFGVSTLIKAMALINREIPGCRLDIYGDGSEKSNLIDLGRKIGVSEVINFNDVVPAEAIVKIMQNADVGIDPMMGGLFFGEVLTVKSLEFLTVGIPLLISRTRASEYYYDSSMVKYFEPESPDELAKGVIDLYRDPNKRREMVRNGRRFAEKHNWQRYKEEYYRIVDELCVT
jgi:glycosyltransferase involved in cell wall biosynthesis